MKKLLFPILFMLGCLAVNAQTIIDHPIDVVNSTVEANEFLIFHTDGLGNSAPATKTTIGRYDPTGGSLSQKIVEASSVTNPSNVQTQGGKFLNAIALDYNGDSYDEVVYVVENANGVKGLTIPTINKGTLDATIAATDIVANLPTPSSSGMETVKMDKGDFDGDGKEELILLTRSVTTGSLRIQLRDITGPSNVQNSTLQKEASAMNFVPLSNSAYEAFDIAVGDFDRDDKLDLAVVAFEQGPTNRQCVLQYYEVTPPDLPSFPAWSINPKGKIVLGATGSSSGIENVAIVSARQSTGFDQVTVALAYRDPNDQNTIQRRVFTVITDRIPNLYDLNDPMMLAPPYVSSVNNGGNLPAISMDAGDLVNGGEEEIAIAWDGEVQVFSSFPGSIVLRATSGVGTVQDEFYKLTNGNSYLSIGDMDYDKSKEILVVTTDDDGNSGNTMHSMRVTLLNLSQDLQTLSVTAQKEIQPQQWAGASSDYHLCATVGEFQGGRAILKEPTKSLKKLFIPLIINNGPPHHFDIVNNVEADILEAYPNWPSTAGTGTISSQYLAVNSTTRTLETTLNSDWGVSSTLSAGFSKLGNSIKASITGKYGEEFSKTQTNTSTVTISTLSTALSDDQVYGVVQDYEVFEYPVDSSGYTIGYVLAMMRKDQPIVQWMDSKSTDAINYISDHEPGNLFSYPSSSNFDDYAGVSELIRTGTSKNIGNGGSLEFTMAFSDFASSSASVARKFGVEVNASANASLKYVDVGLDVTGTYNQEEVTTHTSTAFSEISFTSNLSRALNPQFSDAFYTVTPKVYWAQNGALTLGYAVDPSLPTGGLSNFWSDNYNTHPDLSMILPWRLDAEKGFSLGSTPDKERLSKSISLSRNSFATGDTIVITAFIHNFSFVDYTGEVEYQFYAGNPDEGGILLSDINGLSTAKIVDSYLARERTPIEFWWKVPPGLSPAPRIYVVIDPNNKITEVHDDNNVGFHILGDGTINAIGDEEVEKPLQLKLFPNPANERAQLDVVLPESGQLTVGLFDMQGRLLKTVYDQYLHRGNFILPIELAEFPSGYYMVKVNVDQKQAVLKLVKTN